MSHHVVPIPAFIRDYVRYSPDTGVMIWTQKTGKKVIPGDPVGGYDQSGYKRFRFFGVLLKVHRVAWFIQTGEQPEFIDHIKGVRDDNRWINLRSVPLIVNSYNTERHRGGRTPGVLRKPSGKW